MSERMAFVVTDGDYSDYHVVAVFDDRGAAERFVATNSLQFTQWWQNTQYRIEEYALNAVTPQVPAGYSGWYVKMLHDGSLADDKYDPVGAYQPFVVSDKGEVALAGLRWHVLNLDNERTCLYVTCLARDQQHAIKIANEKRAELIATGQFPATVADMRRAMAEAVK